MTSYKELRLIDVSEHLDIKTVPTKKGNVLRLTYLSWAWALDQLMQLDENATWEFGEPATFEDGTMMLFCTVNAFGRSRTAFLPVLDSHNSPVSKPDAMTVNTTMQRVLTKAIALHGIGLYIYAGEDLPPDEPLPEQKPKQTARAAEPRAQPPQQPQSPPISPVKASEPVAPAPEPEPEPEPEEELPEPTSVMPEPRPEPEPEPEAKTKTQLTGTPLKPEKIAKIIKTMGAVGITAEDLEMMIGYETEAWTTDVESWLVDVYYNVKGHKITDLDELKKNCWYPNHHYVG